MLSRKRSVVWGFFKYMDSETVQCLLCRGHLVRSEQGTTTNMLRHLRTKHPAQVKRMKAGLSSSSSSPHQHVDADGEPFCSVEVALEDGDCDTITVQSEADIHSAVKGILEAAQGEPAERVNLKEATEDRPARRKRSLIWRHYETLASMDAVRCRACMKKLQCSEGSTSNLRRHLSSKHPELFSELISDQQSSSQGAHVNGTAESKLSPAEAEQDDRDSSREKNADLNSAVNSILEPVQGRPAEQITLDTASIDRHKSSLIWRCYERLVSLNAVRCHICTKKLQFFEGGSSRHLHLHMSKRHPEMFSLMMIDQQNPLTSHSSQGVHVNGDTSAPSETAGTTEKSPHSGALKVSQGSDGDGRLFRRERELMESLRRAQREEARALDHQRELLEKLRAVNVREAAAERERIESLRKVQMEEAKDLSRQKEELQKEKAELQKKWEELRQEREELLLFTRGHPPDSGAT